MMTTKIGSAVVVVLVCVVSQARAGKPADRSLYERLGKKEAITAVVDDFVGNLVADARINSFFAKTDVPKLKRLLVEQICQATGGPCTYSGRDMRTVHDGMNITGPQFDALVQDLVKSLDKFKVPAREKGELLGALGGMKPEIVDNGAAAPRAASAGAPAAAGTAVAGTAMAGKSSPAIERAAALREAASLLEKAAQTRDRGQRTLAEQLFTSAELIAGPEALADLATQFREGAPPRVTTPLTQMPLATARQPAAVGSSDDDAPDARPKRGSLSGVLRIDGKPVGEPAVITLEPANGRFARRTPVHRVVEQRGRDFAPRVLAIPTGSTVAFPNFDAIYHNVFSRSDAAAFDLGNYRNGQSREFTFAKDGLVHLGCNLHSNMSAYIVVVSQPHYVLTDGSGRFKFRSLEPGRYKMRVFSERSEPAVQEIVVKPSANEVAFDVHGHAPAPSTDKFGVARAR
jgi:hemoglobin